MPKEYKCPNCWAEWSYRYLEYLKATRCPTCSEPLLAAVTARKDTKLTTTKEKADMPFSMGFSKESLSGAPPVPDGWYLIQFSGFKQVASRNKDSINLNPQFEITQNADPELNGRKVWSNLNTKGTWVIQDFVHACGLEMEQIPGTEDYSIPGVFKDMETYPDNPEKWEYLGPLTNKVFEAEVFTSEYQGKKSNKIKQFKCALPNCTEKHSTNLGG